MKTLLAIVSLSGLALMLAAAIMVFRQSLDLKTYNVLLLVGTALWFVPVPFWMKRRLHHSE